MPVRPETHKPRRAQTKSHGQELSSWGKARGGRPWQRKRERVFKRDKYLCQICLQAGIINPVDLHGPNHGVCDHIKPKSRGGDDSESNLQTICQRCDKVKTGKESRG